MSDETYKKEEASPKPLLVDVNEAARLTSLSARTVWRFVSCGKFPRPLKVGGRRLWRPVVIAQWVADGCPMVERTRG